jgi:hypothetical protein
MKHRSVKHRKYNAFGITWCLDNTFSSRENRSIERIAQWKGPEVAEKYMVSLFHDVEDKIWDFDGVRADQRREIREYWEALCVWLVLNPEYLKTWAGVDVVAGPHSATGGRRRALGGRTGVNWRICRPLQKGLFSADAKQETERSPSYIWWPDPVRAKKRNICTLLREGFTLWWDD